MTQRLRRSPTPRPPAARPVTLGATARAVARRLRAAGVSFGHGTTNAWDEAVYLVLHALRLPLDDLASVEARALSAAELRRIDRLVAARIRRRLPAAYLTREAWLGDFRFYVDERAIVPRSFIAELLRNDLAPWVPDPARVRHALDLCTGSGCLAILLAHAFPRAHVDAVDVSPGALAVARRNVGDYRLSERIALHRGDLFATVGDRRYDLIVSNPPYVTAAAMRRLPAEYRREPALALAGGRDGLDIVRRLLAEAAAHLTPDGLLVVEVGHARARVERAFPALPFVWADTSAGADCVFLLRKDDISAAAADRPRARKASVR